MLEAKEGDSQTTPLAAPGAAAKDVVRPLFWTPRPTSDGRFDGQLEQIIDVVPVALCLCDGAGRITVWNRRAAELWRRDAELARSDQSADWFTVVGADGHPVLPEANVLGLALREGKSCRDIELILRRADGTRFDASVTIDPLRDDAGKVCGAITVVVDITDRRKRDRHAAFLTRLTERLASAGDESEIVKLAAALVGEHLGVDRCGFVENEPDSGTIKALPGWTRESVSSLVGRHDLHELGGLEWRKTVASSLVAVDDVMKNAHTREYADSYRNRAIRGFAAAPFTREGRWVASLTVTTSEPRPWTDDELVVLENVVSRVWPRVERRRAQSLLQLLIADAPVVLAYMDRDGRIMFANRAFAARWAVEPSSLVGKPLSSVLGPQAVEVLQPYIDRVLKGESIQFEIEIPYIGVGRRYVQVSYAPDRDVNGEVRGFLSAVSDITDRRAMEQAVRESEKRYRELVDVLPVGLYVCNAEGRLVLFNEAAAEIWGRRPELEIERWGGAIAAYDREGREIPRESWPLARAYRSGEVVQPEEVEIMRADGSRRIVVSRPRVLHDGAGNVVGGMNVLVDVTDRRKAEANLRDRDERLLLATRTGKLGIWDWDMALDRITWTDSLYEIHGVSRADFVPTLAGFSQLIHSEDRESVAERIKASIERDQPYELEFRAVRGDGTIAWLFTNARVMRQGGRPVRMVGATFDITERKRAELALAETEQRFRALAEHAPVGIVQTDRRGECVFVNQQWCRMAAMTELEACGTGWFRAIHPDDRERVQLAWQEAVKQGSQFATECRLLRSDGIVSWVQTSAAEFRDRGGALLGHIGTVVDITERKAGEFALRESEKRFRLLASRAPVGIFMTNPAGETVFVNASWCHIAGLTPEEAQGYGWTKALHPDDSARIMAEWQDAARRGISVKAEYRFLRRDGTVTWVHGTAVQVRDSSGRLTGYIGTVADFTENKEAELALRESEERFRMLADNIAQFAWICDAAGKYVWINQRFQEYTGLNVEDLNSGRLYAIHHPDHEARVSEKFARHVVTGESWEDSFPLRGRRGGYRWFLARAIPIRDSGGRITRWFGTNTDITDWRDAQEMLRRAQDELLAHAGDLERKVEARTASLREAIVQMEEFSYSVSHDLRAPLRAMNAYADALLEDYGPSLDETARDYLRRIQRSSLRMEKLTHDVLTYSRLARAEVVLGTVDVGAVLRDLIGQYSELQPAAADISIEDPLHRVRGHEVSLGQCLGNLLTNAVKFVAPGVRPHIRIFTSELDGLVRIWVADNGIGIRPEHQRNLFQMFERVPTTTPYDGTGIGLAIVRKAVEKMGGRYGVESDGIHGSRFWVELPRA